MEKLDEDKIENTINNLLRKYVQHSKGFFIVAPSGSGKTYFTKNQKELNWIDGDELWMASGAHPDREWWLESMEIIHEVDKRSDFVTQKAKEKGLWIMGASNAELQPDAIVVPEWEDHIKMIKHREENDYDGGAKSNPDSIKQLKDHIETIMEWKEKGVPHFKTIKDAADFLASSVA